MKYLVIKRAEAVLDNFLAKSALAGIFGGMIFTLIVQSSSITTSLLVPLVGAGILTIEAVFPVVVGANIGTTGTAILASLATGNIYGITIAFAHFLFNLIGVLFIYPIKLFRIIPINLAKFLGNLAYKEKGYALVYVLGLFFVVPALLILISKYFE
jgi:sodium-dependent phosphate cotransporter